MSLGLSRRELLGRLGAARALVRAAPGVERQELLRHAGTEDCDRRPCGCSHPGKFEPRRRSLDGARVEATGPQHRRSRAGLARRRGGGERSRDELPA